MHRNIAKVIVADILSDSRRTIFELAWQGTTLVKIGVVSAWGAEGWVKSAVRRQDPPPRRPAYPSVAIKVQQ